MEIPIKYAMIELRNYLLFIARTSEGQLLLVFLLSKIWKKTKERQHSTLYRKGRYKNKICLGIPNSLKLTQWTVTHTNFSFITKW